MSKGQTPGTCPVVGVGICVTLAPPNTPVPNERLMFPTQLTCSGGEDKFRNIVFLIISPAKSSIVCHHGIEKTRYFLFLYIVYLSEPSLERIVEEGGTRRDTEDAQFAALALVLQHVSLSQSN